LMTHQLMRITLKRFSRKKVSGEISWLIVCASSS
jgi:hypothetical protein